LSDDAALYETSRTTLSFTVSKDAMEELRAALKRWRAATQSLLASVHKGEK
jgi:hypothetical protein